MLNTWTRAFFAAVLAVPVLVSAGPAGTFVCAVDNCVRSYTDSGQVHLDACRAGVRSAVQQGESNGVCRAMCEKKYQKQGESVQEACTLGCTLFPSKCLRDGEIPPEPRTRK